MAHNKCRLRRIARHASFRAPRFSLCRPSSRSLLRRFNLCPHSNQSLPPPRRNSRQRNLRNKQRNLRTNPCRRRLPQPRCKKLPRKRPGLLRARRTPNQRQTGSILRLRQQRQAIAVTCRLAQVRTNPSGLPIVPINLSKEGDGSCEKPPAGRSATREVSNEPVASRKLDRGGEYRGYSARTLIAEAGSGQTMMKKMTGPLSKTPTMSQGCCFSAGAAAVGNRQLAVLSTPPQTGSTCLRASGRRPC